MAIEAVLLAALAQSSLLIAGLVVYRFSFTAKVIGGLAGFGAGALISAVSFDLIPAAADLATVRSALLILAGAAIYILADRAVEARYGSDDPDILWESWWVPLSTVFPNRSFSASRSRQVTPSASPLSPQSGSQMFPRPSPLPHPSPLVDGRCGRRPRCGVA